MSQLADALAVHSEESRVGRRDDVVALLLQLHQRGGGYGFHFGDYDVGLFGLYDFTEFGAVEH